ncbi:hypothetical protein HK405_013542 [Cladochytrium tenue]|nr:hypothetical protein HK405_013542 [Cladochytrium tenue]
MHKTSAAPKLAAVRGYGGLVELCEATQTAREAAVAALRARDPRLQLVHPFDDARVMAGRGTVVLELLEQVAAGEIVCSSGGGGDGAGKVQLDAVVVPVGGGGLLSGSAVAARVAGVRVFAAEPAAADDAWRSFHEAVGADGQPRRERVAAHAPGKGRSIADGLLTTVGSQTWPIVRDLVEDVFVVSEAEIARALKLVFERMKMVIEPSAAVPLAAVLFNPEFRKLQGLRNVGIVITGGNIDLDKPFPWQTLDLS